MRNFLVALSGARTEVLEQFPTERARFQALGLAIVISAVLAVVSMWCGLASDLSLNPFLAGPTALAWGLVILGINRWSVTSMPIRAVRHWAVVMPRLILALLLGALISVPLVLLIFRPEISTQIIVIRQQRANAFLTAQQKSVVGREVSSRYNAVSNLEQIINSGSRTAASGSSPQLQFLITKRTAAATKEKHSYQLWKCQLYGGPDCVEQGSGPLALADFASYKGAAAQVAKLSGEIQQLQEVSDSTTADRDRYEQAVSALSAARQQLNTAMATEDTMLINFDSENNADNGLLIQMRALNQLASENITVNVGRILLFFLFMVIVLLPISVKLMQQAGNYEKILVEIKKRELREARRTIRAQYHSGSTLHSSAILSLHDIWRHLPSDPPKRPIESDESDRIAFRWDDDL